MGRVAGSIFWRAIRLKQPHQRFFSTTDATTSNQQLQIIYERGLPLLKLPLPSRNEPCQFSFRPLTDTVATFCDNLKEEDRGLDYVAIYKSDGTRISVSTSVEHLLQLGSFRLRLNDTYYDIDVTDPQKGILSSDRMRHLDDIRATVAVLHAALCVDDYKLGRERMLIERLEQAEFELQPLLEQKEQIERDCHQHSRRIMWIGFAAMGVQTGLFARLTWWDYSWDIMEPVTYFATYSTVMATLAYYLYTKQNFEYTSAQERVFTKAFYKRAKLQNFDIDNYNRLVKEVEDTRNQLNRLRDPLFQHLPVSYLSRLNNEIKKS